MKNAHTEQDLILPALLVLADKGGYIDTATLKKELTKRLSIHKKDKFSLSDGTTRFNKTVGNLVSHRTLNKYVKYSVSAKGNVGMKINAAGRKALFSALTD